jgi:hypothetical protein
MMFAEMFSRAFKKLPYGLLRRSNAPYTEHINNFQQLIVKRLGTSNKLVLLVGEL